MVRRKIYILLAIIAIAVAICLSASSAKRFFMAAISQTSVTVLAPDYSPARVRIDAITSNTVSNITANSIITNEGEIDYEYQYEWCVVANVSNPCGSGGGNIFYASASKLIQKGETWATNLTATVPSPGTYWFKLTVYYGNQSSSASVAFSAQTAGGGGGGGGGTITTPTSTPTVPPQQQSDPPIAEQTEQPVEEPVINLQGDIQEPPPGDNTSQGGSLPAEEGGKMQPSVTLKKEFDLNSPVIINTILTTALFSLVGYSFFRNFRKRKLISKR